MTGAGRPGHTQAAGTRWTCLDCPPGNGQRWTTTSPTEAKTHADRYGAERCLVMAETPPRTRQLALEEPPQL